MCRFDGRLYGEGVSFKLLDGYFIDSAVLTDTVCCVKQSPPDGGYYLEIRLEQDSEGAEAELDAVIKAFRPLEIYSRGEIEIKGIKGRQASFLCCRSERYEAWFDIGDASKAINVVLCSDTDISTINISAILDAIDPQIDEA